jgi:large-conductance mechanosensitive channel
MIALKAGVIIGAIYKIVASLAQDVIMPMAGKLFDGVHSRILLLDPLKSLGMTLSLAEAQKPARFSHAAILSRYCRLFYSGVCNSQSCKRSGFC